MLIDVLVPVMFIDFELQSRNFGQHLIGQARADQNIHAEPGLRRADQLGQLVADPLRGNHVDPFGHFDHRAFDLGMQRHPELGHESRRAHHPERIVGKRILSPARRAQHSGVKVLDPTVRIDQFHPRQAQSHGVHGEIPALQISLERIPESHLGLA